MILKILLCPIAIPFLFVIGFLMGGDNGGSEKWSFKRALQCSMDAMGQWWE